MKNVWNLNFPTSDISWISYFLWHGIGIPFGSTYYFETHFFGQNSDDNLTMKNQSADELFHYSYKT